MNDQRQCELKLTDYRGSGRHLTRLVAGHKSAADLKAMSDGMPALFTYPRTASLFLRFLYWLNAPRRRWQHEKYRRQLAKERAINA